MQQNYYLLNIMSNLFDLNGLTEKMLLPICFSYFTG
jgi:hypothetical protein